MDNTLWQISILSFVGRSTSVAKNQVKYLFQRDVSSHSKRKKREYEALDYLGVGE